MSVISETEREYREKNGLSLETTLSPIPKAVTGEQFNPYTVMFNLADGEEIILPVGSKKRRNPKQKERNSLKCLDD